MLALVMVISGILPANTAVSASTTDAGTAVTVKHQSVQDPGIVVGYVKPDVTAGNMSSSTIVKGTEDDSYTKEVYFLFGSHMAWAYSFDLQNWTTFTNNINTDYQSLFAKEFAWAGSGDRVYSAKDNILSPDVIWNPELGKWCMYMSIKGYSWNSSICLLTADSLRGTWTYAQTVLYSGFSPDGTYGYTETDYEAVTGDTILPSRYTFTNMYQCSDGTTLCAKTSWNYEYGAHAVDPCVFYDEEAQLWMSYGSCAGGIWMVRLDPVTGLRDPSVTYEYVNGVTDPYMGYRLAGGNDISGEASHIRHIGDYYYLFLTYGDSEQGVSTNLRMFRSEKVTGPYVDVSGDPATKITADQVQGNIGVRFISSYKWSYMDAGYVLGGHNSILVDDDGSLYIVYQIQSVSDNSIGETRVHQIFTTADGWLVVAPFEYSGETLSSSLTTNQAAGAYEVIFQEAADGSGQACTEGITLGFSQDGTITGERNGSWNWSKENGAPYVTMVIDGDTYEGVFLQQKKETAASASGTVGTTYAVGKQTMVFTVLGTQKETAVWGYNLQWEDTQLVERDADTLYVQSTTLEDLNLPSYGPFGTQVIWESDHPEVLGADGTVTSPEEPTEVILTATFLSGQLSRQKQYTVTVYPAQESGKPLVLATYFTDTPVSLADAEQETYCFPNPFRVEGLRTDNGVSIKFDIQTTGNANWSDTIFSIHDGAGAGLYLNGETYLGYRGGNGDYFDANVKNESFGTWEAGTDFTGTSAKVEIRILPDSFAVYVNGIMVYDQSSVEQVLAGKESYRTPGEISVTDLSTVLDDLLHTATTLNFGWSSSGQGGYEGNISNVVISALPVVFDGDDVPQHEHEYQVEVIPATRRSMGEITYTCQTCDATTENHSYTESFPMIALGIPDVSVENEEDGIRISWNRQEDADGYYLYKRMDNVAWSDTPYVVIEGNSTVTYKDTQVLSGYHYTYTVCAFNSSQTGAYYTAGQSEIYLEEPIISGITNTTTGIQVRWRKVSAAGGYRIYRKTGKSGSWEYIGAVAGENTLTYTDTTAKAGVTYYYTVSSYKEESESTYNTVGTRVVRLTRPGLPTVKNTSAGIQLNWSQVSGAAGYYVYRKTSGGSWVKYATVSGAAVLTYTDTKVTSGTVYSYSIQAYNTSFLSTYHPIGRSVVRLSSASVTKATVTTNGVAVRWKKVTGAKGYYVYRKTGTGSYKLIRKITGGSTLRYVDQKASNGKKSTYKVAAYSGSSVGTSASTKTTIYLKAPKLSSVKNTSKKALTVKLGKNAKAGGYEIQYSKKSGFSSAKIVKVKSAKTTKKIIRKLKKTTYYVRVRAYKKSGKTIYYSAWSSKCKVRVTK